MSCLALTLDPDPRLLWAARALLSLVATASHCYLPAVRLALLRMYTAAARRSWSSTHRRLLADSRLGSLQTWSGDMGGLRILDYYQCSGQTVVIRIPCERVSL